MKRILVPVNFSESSANALKYAYALSRDLKAPLTLLHCFSDEAYNRPYDFKGRDYSMGIQKMLRAFYKQHIGEDIRQTDFLALEGSVSIKIARISDQFSLVVLSGDHPDSKRILWMGSKVSYIASQSHCPVLILPDFKSFGGYEKWQKIWHIKLLDNEKEIIGRYLSKLKLHRKMIEEKSFEQTTFKSAFWKAFVTYLRTPKEEQELDLVQSIKKESIDLLLLVSHGKYSFDSFMKNDAVSMLFNLDTPILIFQETD